MGRSKNNYTADEEHFLKNIGFKIQFLRRQRNISQEELAEKCGLSYSTIGHVESTEVYGISIVSIYRIALALKVAPSQLLVFD